MWPPSPEATLPIVAKDLCRYYHKNLVLLARGHLSKVATIQANTVVLLAYVTVSVDTEMYFCCFGEWTDKDSFIAFEVLFPSLFQWLPPELHVLYACYLPCVTYKLEFVCQHSEN